MRCSVCGLDCGRTLSVADASLGSACPGECTALLWWSHYLRVTGGTDDEHAELLWQWQCRRAVAGGRRLPPRPQSAAERELDAAIAARGWTDVARELE